MYNQPNPFAKEHFLMCPALFTQSFFGGDGRSHPHVCAPTDVQHEFMHGRPQGNEIIVRTAAIHHR